MSNASAVKGNRGVSLIELLIVMSIGALLAVLFVYAWRSGAARKQFNADVDTTMMYIQRARSQTLASQDASQYGVHFTTDTATLFKGDTFDSTDPDNVEYEFDPRVDITETSLSDGSSDVVFSRLTGESSATGTLTFHLSGDTAATSTVIINEGGVVSKEINSDI